MGRSDEERVAAARLSLDGLSVGDALGERFFGPPDEAVRRIEARAIPEGPWRYTDDTEMAISIAEALIERGRIDQDDLARRFAGRFSKDRGYGRSAFEILWAVENGADWGPLSRGAFGGRGSFGNGAAMRVAPLGAYFSDDLERACDEAKLSAEITHSHPEGIAGAVAVAAAAAIACRAGAADLEPGDFLRAVIEHVPAGYTREGIEEALALLPEANFGAAARALGNGSDISAPDTVPYCLWSAARHLGSYEDAFWETVSALGDRDTTCAIVGGIVATSAGRSSIPKAWLAAREALPI